MKLEPVNQIKLFAHKEQFENLIKLYAQNKLPNKILFSGEKGIGKSTIVYHFINFVLSENEEYFYDYENNAINSENKSYKLIQNKSNPNFNLIKGGGGAHLREKIVATASDQMIVIADSLKKVSKLGSFPLPVEVVQYGCESTKTQVMRYSVRSGYKSPKVMFRGSNEKRFITDEGNFILDLHLNSIFNEETLANDLNLIPGVLENGLFINICDCVVLADSNELVTVNWKEGHDRNSRNA